MAKQNRASRRAKLREEKAIKDNQGRVVTPENAEKYVLPPVSAMSAVQKEYLHALRNYQVVVFLAPAGVGKTFLTMAEMTDSIKKGEHDTLYLSRPAVGMGNTVGLLKGDVRDKYEPYLMPMVDAIKSRYGANWYENALKLGTVKFELLEYLRGRNLDSLVCVDEFQNCTPAEAYTIITRVAEGGKLVLLGDPTQTDIKGVNAMQWLPDFIEANPELQDHIKIIRATSDDIVRGGLCKAMVKAKERTGLLPK